ncbi:hypothetical protein BCR37DRAFT_218739 [Protomyces lactucae-debilis]|uniref:Uncharacterized protein n=1 Tax=Protomyces lactucae-debilis TaxID=2754530 RepID=A0A1Y2FQT8_PROLT|nr:uncharacterized protein BCR37DRAFT_218739 [Protomyces lactucae-debilis]ORY86360.1 hypothetical protein BCR37DRAFT_218739 [Protomyces lactucae-debilis]
MFVFRNRCPCVYATRSLCSYALRKIWTGRLPAEITRRIPAEYRRKIPNFAGAVIPADYRQTTGKLPAEISTPLPESTGGLPEDTTCQRLSSIDAVATVGVATRPSTTHYRRAAVFLAFLADLRAFCACDAAVLALVIVALPCSASCALRDSFDVFLRLELARRGGGSIFA